jgi:putative endonuclease
MYTVYVLKSTSKAFRYIGMTNDLKRRLQEHDKGYSKTTSRFLPVELVHSEVFDTRVQARVREKFLKSGVGREFLNSLKI